LFIGVNLKMLNWGVNFCALGALLVGAACGPSPRPVPQLPSAPAEAEYVPAKPALAWSMDTGAGMLAPVASRGAAFFATTTNRTVVAVAGATGRRFWYQRFDSPINTGIEIQDGRLYFATESLKGEAFALDAVRGRKVWSRRIGPTRLKPLALPGQVIFATDSGSLVALGHDRGDVKWRTRFNARLVMQPVAADGRIITATSADTIYAVDANTGAILQRRGLPGRPSAAPLLLGNTLYVVLIESVIAALNTDSLTILQQAKFEGPAFAAPQALGRSVYVLTRDAQVWRLAGGQMQRIAELGSAANSSFSVVGSHLIAGLLDGRVLALDENGQLVWEYKAPRSVVAPVTPIADGLLVPLKNGAVLKLR
jgi:outer membrane protein assembly factor BamB